MKDNIPYGIAVIGAVAGVGVTIWLVLILPLARQRELLVEVGKAAISVVPLAFFGVIVAGLVKARDDRRGEALKEAEENRAEQRRLDDFRRRFLADLVAAYNRTKAARRSIRAAGIDPARNANFVQEQVSAFHAQLDVLMDAQLDLESLKREAASRKASFRKGADIVAALEILEEYVNLIGEDREHHPDEIGVGTKMTKLQTWEHLAAFLKNVRDGGDFKRASTEVAVIEAAIWPDLRNPPPPQD